MKHNVAYEELEFARKSLVIVYLAVAVWYLVWRVGTLNKDALVFSSLVYAAELYGFFITLMHIFMTWRLTLRKPIQSEPGKTVDIFITTYNEEVSLLRKTLLAANNMEYPHQTWLLDDGKRPEMEQLAKEMRCRYLSREDNKDAKAGNLNNALKHSTAEFIAIFDADHAPKKNFIVQTLGFLRDSSVAFVQTPQDFYNLDSFQHHKKDGKAVAWHEQAMFFRVIQRGKDYWNAAFFCGSCALIRRSCLDAIGGFATGTVTEDLHTSVKLHKKGFVSIFYPEPLAFGLAPSGIVPYLKQRIRWGQGAMQVWRKEGVFFCKNLTIAQRINYLASTITYFDGWQKGLFYIAPAIVLVTGVMPLIDVGSTFLLHFIPYFLLTFWVFEEVNRGYGRSLVIEQYNMARFAAMAWSTLGIFKNSIKFRVTPKAVDTSSSNRPYIIPQMLIMAGNGLAIPVGIFLYFYYHHLPPSGVIANIIWSMVNTLLAVSITLFIRAYSRFKRSDYRFPIPLPAMIQFAEGTKYYGTIDDISSSGFRIYSTLPKDTVANTYITGKIYLPSGSVSFTAVIRALIPGVSGQEQYVKAAGCTFVWSEESQQDKLSLFLYGSDMQLSLNSLNETVQTPLGWLAKFFSKKKRELEALPEHWNTVVYSTVVQSELKAGLISSAIAGSQSRKLLSFSPVPVGTALKVGVYSRQGMTIIYGEVGIHYQTDTPVSPFFIHQFNQTAAESV
jgi:cellulose synthase (UDP-forming)